MDNEKQVALTLGAMIALVAGLIMLGTLGGCSFKVETLYHGQTPIGLDNRSATQIRAVTEPTPTPHRADRTGY